jgi:hypothetical protein
VGNLVTTNHTACYSAVIMYDGVSKMATIRLIKILGNNGDLIRLEQSEIVVVLID